MHSSIHALESKTYTAAPADLRSVLLELVELLEDYAPMWYTEELHNRAGAALGLPAFEPAIH